MTRIYTFTSVVRVNTGPPTWRRPRLRVTLGRVVIVRAGWLRACIEVGIGAGRARDAEAADA